MREGLLTRQSLVRIRDQELLDQVLALGRDVGELDVVEVELSAGDLLQKLIHALALERQVSAQKCVEDDTEGPDIRLPPVQVLDHFWRHVVRRTGKLGQCALFGDSGQAEINQTNLIIDCHHDVLGLDISVNDIQSVTVIDCLEELTHVEGGKTFREVLIRLRGDLIEERLTLGQLHDQVDVLEIVVRLKVVDDVGVVKRVQQSYLVHDVVKAAVQLLFVHHLDRDLHLRVE